MGIIEQTIISELQKQSILSPDGAKNIEELMNTEKKSIGSVLLEKSYLEKERLLIFLVEIVKKGVICLENLNEFFPISLEEFLVILAKSLNLKYIDLDSVDIDYRLAARAPIVQLKKYQALPISEDEISVSITLKDPMDINAQEAMQRIYPRKLIKILVADPNQIAKYQNKLELSESIRGLIGEIRKEITTSAAENPQESSGILKLIEIILKTAILARSSDIHVEPTINSCIVRCRIDGMLNETFMFDKDIYPPLSSRIKLLSNMDIAEKRKPQDGRFSATILNKEFDFRVSSLPILNGESIVMRILDKSKVMIKLEELGMSSVTFGKFKNAMHSPYGIIFVTGPTGSGKTTTLYAALNDIKSVQTKIITVEDPVEYQLNLTQQTQVNEKSGLNFASALKSILRQDPDIIMIGEVRDKETLQIAVQAALTGHLVFSTLHTNDSISAITRIVDMGIEPYLVSGSLVAIEAQRLVRKLCPYCKVISILPDSLAKTVEGKLPQNYQFYRAKGCEKCSQTGYLGREMISEILAVSEVMQSMIAKGASKVEIEQQAQIEGFVDMFTDGIIRAASGITSIEEVVRVAKL